MYWRLLTRSVGLLTILGFVLFGLTPLPNHIARSFAIPADIRPADAVVVLGAGIEIDGSLTAESTRRFLRGVTLFKTGAAPVLVLLGAGQEAAARALLARDLGIPPSASILLSTANTTREESQLTAESIQPENMRTIVLVTESLHMRRAKLLFEKAGFTVFPAPSDRHSESAYGADDRLALSLRVVQETVALIYYRVAGYL